METIEKPRPASDEMVSKMTVKLSNLIKSTRVAVVRGDVTPHQGKYKAVSGANYFNKIIHLVELDFDAKGNLTEQDLRLNSNWNNGIAARLPKGGLQKGDVVHGFETCNERFEGGPSRSIFPGKFEVFRHAPERRIAVRAVRNTSAAKNPLPISRILKMYRKTNA